jgi:uncharacterized protein
VKYEEPIEFGVANVALNPSPIRAEWVLEGKPFTRFKLLSNSADGTASTVYWDCTAGRFNWFYDMDETLCVLEGSVRIKDESGKVRRLGAGDWVFFPKGSHAEWTVDHYVRKIAFCRTPMPRSVQFARGVYRVLKRLAGRGAAADTEAGGMFQPNKSPQAH